VGDFAQSASSAPTITVGGATTLDLTAVLKGDVDGSWTAASGSSILGAAHFVELVASIAATDADASLARWGIYNT
jgi:hypothetical protein